jgi:tRNA (cytosine38-C5)-methyltransferase
MLHNHDNIFKEGFGRYQRAMKRSHTDLVRENPVGMPDTAPLRYVEFFAGVGGWTMALQEAIQIVYPSDPPELFCSAALDHSDLCIEVFEHNHSLVIQKAVRIEKLTMNQIFEYRADIWMMSPPCQPHTRQHSNQDQELEDPRSRSFLHLCDLLLELPSENLPKLIFLENVVGFESSQSCRKWNTILQSRQYIIKHFHLNPTQVGVPNDRPRYFCLAVRSTEIHDSNDDDLQFHVHAKTKMADSDLHPITPDTNLPNLNIKGLRDSTVKVSSVAEFLDKDLTEHQKTSLRIPQSILQRNAAWCFDIVTPESLRSACFTSSYGKFVKGTGSVLYTGPYRDRIRLTNPEDRKFDDAWDQGLDLPKHLRYFSGSELARIFGFPSTFSFPETITRKQQWKLIGNSLNVRVAAKLVELGLRITKRNKIGAIYG